MSGGQVKNKRFKSPAKKTTWNLCVLYFCGWTLQKKVFSNQNKGHVGSRHKILRFYVDKPSYTF